ncbi:Adenine phosphoribosyltransferase [Richelia intracellularis HH01]|uniref:Adenine phosphoribosyltransferase n=2 Tax=Richelia TaxID=98443 RepID=M1X268_9NOST|nr:Adenine phosphoribosyltransferase [Richelia intracellularis HH01]
MSVVSTTRIHLLLMDLKSLIRDVPDFPKPGIVFRDITTLLRDPDGLKHAIDSFTQKFFHAGINADYIVGMESRGFIFGPPLAYQMGAGFIPVRKPGKLPSAVYCIEYELEYGTDCLEIHQDALHPGSKVLIVDDLIATGGTANATARLVKKSGCDVVGFGFIIELQNFQGRKNLPNVPIITLVEYL